MPCGVKIVSTWFKYHSGSIFGVWATCAVAGNLLGLLIATMFTGSEGAEALVPTLVVPATLTIALAPLVVGVLALGEHNRSDEDRLSILEVLRIPKVATWTSAYVGANSVNVSLFFWIVLFFHESLSQSQTSSDLLAMLYDLGIIIGAMTAGYASDLAKTRSLVFTVFLMFSGILLCFIGWVTNVGAAAILILLIGIGIGGPSMLMTTAISTDISQLSGKPVTASVVGIIDGTGSFFAGFAQLIIGFCIGRVSWGVVFVFLAQFLFIASALTLHLYAGEEKGKGIPLPDEDSAGENGVDEKHVGDETARVEEGGKLDSEADATEPLLESSKRES